MDLQGDGADLEKAAVAAHGEREGGSRRMVGDSFPLLLDGARAGRPDAFAQLYRALQPALLRYLWVGLRDRAEDVAAETWVEVVKRLDRFEGDETEIDALRNLPLTGTPAMISQGSGLGEGNDEEDIL